MKRVIKKAFSIFMAISLVMSMTVVPSFAEGETSAGDIYLSISYLDVNDDPLEESSVLHENDEFGIVFSVAGVSTASAADSMGAYDILVGYDNTKVAIDSIVQGRIEGEKFEGSFKGNESYNETTFWSGWANETGYGYTNPRGKMILCDSGDLFIAYGTALTEISLKDLKNSITLLESATGDTQTLPTHIDNGNKQRFNIILTPALSASDSISVEGITTSSNAEDVKNALSASDFTFINASGATEEVNVNDLTVTLPEGGLQPGDNTVTVSYQGASTQITVNAKKRLAAEDENYIIELNPTETPYTGSAIGAETVDVTVKDGTTTIAETEYTVEFSNNTNAGSAVVTVKNADGGDYILEDKTANFTITKAANSITGLAMEGWTYGDSAKQPTATATYGIPVYTYSDAEDGTYTDAVPTNAGTYYVKATVAEGNNYAVATSEPLSFVISQKEASLSWDGADSRAYNGSPFNVTASVSNLESGDECIVTVTNGDKKDAGTYTATATKLSNNNYKLPENATQTYTITQVRVTPSVNAVESKDYDGTTTVTGNPSLAVSGGVNGEKPTATGIFSWVAKDAGTKAVNVIDIVLDEAFRTNYELNDNELTNVSANGAEINKANTTAVLSASPKTLLSKSIVGDEDKTYEIDLSTAISGMPEDSGTLTYAISGATPTFISDVDVNGSTLTFKVKASDALDESTAETDGIININVGSKNYNDKPAAIGLKFKDKVPVNVTLAGVTMQYGGTPEPQGQYEVTDADGATWTYTYTTAGDNPEAINPSTANVGTYTITAVYEDDETDEATGIPGHTGTATAKLIIEPKTVDVEWTSDPLTYNGTAQAPTPSVKTDSAVNGESIALKVKESKTNAGENYTAEAEIDSVTGGNATVGNYSLNEETFSKTYSIAKAKVTVKSGITASDKTYDGGTNATLNCDNAVVEGLFGSDTVTVTATGEFDNASVGASKPVSITPAIGENENYELAASGNQASTTASITAKDITIKNSGIAAKDKPYDGTKAATLDLTNITATTFEGVVNADAGKVQLDGSSAAGEFAQTNKGTDISVTVTGFTLTGEAAGNYNLTTTSVTATADIEPLIAELSWSGNGERVYDGTTSGVTAAVSNLISGDSCDVTVTGGTEKNAGTHTATATQLSNSNYSLPVEKTKEYVISKFPVVVAVGEVENKVFDSNTNASGSLVVSPKTEGTTIPDSNLSADGTIQWASPNAGTTKVNVTGITLSDAVNYSLDSDSLTNQIPSNNPTITKAPAPELSLVSENPLILLSNKVQTGEKPYAFYDIDRMISGIPQNAGTVTYASAENGKEGYISDASMSGKTLNLKVVTPQNPTVRDYLTISVESTNYTNATVDLNFEFKEKNSVDNDLELADKTIVYGSSYIPQATYKGQTTAGDLWKYTYKDQDNSDPGNDPSKFNVGTYTVIATYEDDVEENDIPGHIGETTATLTVTPKNVTVQWDNTPLVYNGSPQVPSSSVQGVPGEIIEVNVQGQKINAGENYKAEVIGIKSVSGGNASTENYVLTGKTDTIFTISPKPITATFAAESKPYDGTTKATATATLDGVESGDTVNATVTAAFTSADAGTNKDVQVTAVELDSNNYTLATKLPITVKADITPKALDEPDVTIDPTSFTYNGKEQKPAVTVKSGEKTLTESTDYDVTYPDSSKDAGDYSLTVTAKGNYSGTFEKSYTIAPKDLNSDEIVILGVSEMFEYTGERIKPLAEVHDNGTQASLTKDTDYTVEYSDDVTNVGEKTITFAGKGNYIGSRETSYEIYGTDPTGTVTIQTESDTVAPEAVLSVQTPEELGDAASYQWMKNGEPIEGATESTYTIPDDAKEGDEYTVAVTFGDNYSDLPLISEPVEVGKKPLKGTVTIEQNDKTITATPDTEASEDDYEIVWMKDGEETEVTGPTYTVDVDEDAGSAITAKIVPKEDSGYTGEVVSEPIQVPAVAPAVTVNLTPKDKAFEVKIDVAKHGATITNYILKVYEGSGTESEPVYSSIEPIGFENGNAVISVLDNGEPVANGQVYTVSVEAVNDSGEAIGQAEVTPKASGGGGGGGGGAIDDETNTITIPKVENGSATVSPKSAAAGEKVTVTPKANEGFEPDGVEVTDSKGKPVEVKDNGDGTYSFIMPDGPVTVTPKFKPSDDHEKVCPAKKFTDVDITQWYHLDLDFVLNEGMMNGTSDTTFDPQGTTNRAMIVTILYRLEGEPKAAEAPFTDLTQDWYKAAVGWAAENGIVKGTSATTFAPTDPITREQFATILYRYADYKKIDVSQKADLSKYTDQNKIHDYAKDAMSWANAAGLITGMTETTLQPIGNATRAQAAAIFHRFCENVAK